ncbi:hypothetical protein, partial [Geobacillus stearothermophilus]|uniref:hypothetical protein n=1 Tax=Geobacillus stearothermophilus TaxID=1422 RepID=UPI002E1E1663|nr:hypothetical protein [Geobacillus stearothermophilus]
TRTLYASLRSEGVRSSHILSYSLANANRNSSPTFTGAGAPSRLEVGDFFRREVKENAKFF